MNGFLLFKKKIVLPHKTHRGKAVIRLYKESIIHAFSAVKQITFVIFLLIFFNFCLVLLWIVVLSEDRFHSTAVPDGYRNGIASYPLIKKKIDPLLSAASVAVFEKDSRVMIFEKNSHVRLSPASTTKIMTALVALESFSPDERITIDGVDRVQGSHMGLLSGERITVQDLLYGLLLPSGNDASFALAKRYPGGIGAFVWRMNQKSAELKLNSTYFVDPSGYGDENYSTASDLVHLATFALDNRLFAQIVSTREKTVFDESKNVVHKLVNLNRLLGEKGVLGVKTGFTHEAGEVLVTSYLYQGKTYVIAVLKSADRFSDTREIIDKVIRNVTLLSY